MELLFPSAFLALALAHFVALLSPGPDFFLLVGYAARYRLRGSAGLCLGIAAGNGLYILLVIIGWSALRQFGWLFTLIELSGALYLLWIGSHLVRSRPQPLALEETRQRCPSLRKQILLGLGSALLNPKNALFYGANDSVTRAGRHTASAGDLRRLDGDGGAGMGSGADIADGVTGGSAKAQPFALADRAHGRGGVDGVWWVGAVAGSGKYPLREKAAALPVLFLF